MIKRQSAQQLLSAIEAQLKQQSLWQLDYPTIEALSSRLPFCCDTLTFAQWLQFILIPRMSALLEGEHPLPSEIAIAPMAQEAFKDMGIDANQLIDAIEQFDALLSGDDQ